MIRNAIIVALFLILVYSLFLKMMAPPGWGTSQHQWQDNVIKAQAYLYQQKNWKENVIVGSSLSSRILTDSLPQTFNLSFQGQSLFDGLEIIRHQQRLPKRIFVEMNVMWRPLNENFAASFNSTVLSRLREVFPVFRDVNQPIGVAGKYTSAIWWRIWPQSPNAPRPALFNELLQLQVESYKKPPEKSVLSNSFQQLEKEVAEFENNGVTFYFFEMPVNQSLMNLPRATVTRDLFHQYFPPSKYSYLEPLHMDFQTTDGVHLSHQEASQFTRHLKSFLRSAK